MSRMLAAGTGRLFDLSKVASASIERCRRRRDDAGGLGVMSIGAMKASRRAALDRIRGILTDFLITVHFSVLLLRCASVAGNNDDRVRLARVGARRPNAAFTGGTFFFRRELPNRAPPARRSVWSGGRQLKRIPIILKHSLHA